jgi:hypothetical protein
MERWEEEGKKRKDFEKITQYRIWWEMKKIDNRS